MTYFGVILAIIIISLSDRIMWIMLTINETKRNSSVHKDQQKKTQSILTFEIDICLAYFYMPLCISHDSPCHHKDHFLDVLVNRALHDASVHNGGNDGITLITRAT